MYFVAGWVSDVRGGDDGVKIVPRVLLEGWTMADFQEVFATDASMAQVGQFVERLKVRGNGGGGTDIVHCVCVCLLTLILSAVRME